MNSLNLKKNLWIHFILFRFMDFSFTYQPQGLPEGSSYELVLGRIPKSLKTRISTWLALADALYHILIPFIHNSNEDFFFEPDLPFVIQKLIDARKDVVSFIDNQCPNGIPGPPSDACRHLIQLIYDTQQFGELYD